jgi:hypothetical protein
MFESLFADGIVSGASDKIAAFVVKCLAVAGGFLVGYFLGGVIAWALDRWVFAQKAPAPVKKAVSWIAAVALALLVALIVFGDGGNGLFGRGGGSGDGKGSPTQDNNGNTKAPEPKIEPKKEEERKDNTVKPPPSKPMPGDVRVTILSGDVRDGRYYLIDGDPNPKNLDEFKEAILARRKDAKPELSQVIFRFQKSVFSPDHPIVRDPVVWLGRNKISVNFE